MTGLNEIYKCEICGNIVEVLHIGIGELVCCGQPMKFQDESVKDGAFEKHLPIIKGNEVKVGSINHPMEKSHYIEWIEATDGQQISKIFLKPGQNPKAEFCFTPISTRIYCNIHGLWENK